MNLGFLSVRPSISKLLAVNEAVKLPLLILIEVSVVTSTILT